MNLFPDNFTWFLPYIKRALSLREVPNSKFFKLPTLKLIEKSLSSSELLEQLLTERFIWENFSQGFYSSTLLDIVLEERELFGYLIKTKYRIEKFPIFKLDRDLFFYPLEWGKGFKLFNYLWRKGKNFQAKGVYLKKPYSLEVLKENLQFLNLFDFSLLTEIAQKDLENYFPTLEVKTLEELLQKFLKNPYSTFILSNLDIEPLLRDIPQKTKLSSKNHLYLIEDWGPRSLENLIFRIESESLGLTVGILTQAIFKNFSPTEGSPFIMVIGAWEHAKRAQKKIVLFEGFTFHVIGDLYLEWKDFGKALKYYNLAEPYTKQLAELNLSKAAIFYFLGDLEIAEKILKKQLCGCLKEDPFAHYNLGLIFSKKKKIEEAKFHFYKAYLLEPNNRVFRETLVEFLWEVRNLEEIEEVLSEAKNLSIKEKACLGKVYFLKRDYERAYEMLKELLTYSDRDGETLLFLAWLYLYLKREPEISELLTKEAKERLKKSQFEKILKEFNLKVK